MQINVSRCARFAFGAVAAGFLAGCASVGGESIKAHNMNVGYRFEKLPLAAPAAPAKNSEQLFVMLAFSGGGTRAAAMSYGVLAQLRAIKFHVDPVTGEPKSCAQADAACKATERSLLDEVDVISSVSGGSFTSAYYTLFGDRIFDRASPFQDKFLYHRVQSDLAKQAAYFPKNWPNLVTRTEIAANYYANNIFENKTFAALEQRPRPYLILNATDASTGNHFEFTQQQFDLLCADLSTTPISRGVTASSAFPGLLNSIRQDSFNSKDPNCNYKPSAWESLGLDDASTNPLRYRRAKQTAAYREADREHLHLLDGGLSDNLGLRNIILSLESGDQPVQREAGNVFTYGGWSVFQRISRKPIKHVIVITVDARAISENNADTKKGGPGIFGSVNAAASVPMGNYTGETLELMRQIVRERDSTAYKNVTFHAASVGLDNVGKPEEKIFLNAAGTNFELPSFTVNCLMSRSAELLRDAEFVTARNETLTFTDFVRTVLKDSSNLANADVPTPAHCTKAAAKDSIKTTSHTVDVVFSVNMTRRDGNDVDYRRGSGLSVHIAKPNGLGATAGITWPEVVVPAVRNDNVKYTLGRLRLYGVMGGLTLGQTLGRIELNGGINAGVAKGIFSTSSSTRMMFGLANDTSTKITASPAWMVKPSASLWYAVFEKIGITTSASYLISRPTLSFKQGDVITSKRKLQVNAFQLSAGIGYRLF